jgi:hypothetical protein
MNLLRVILAGALLHFFGKSLVGQLKGKYRCSGCHLVKPINTDSNMCRECESFFGLSTDSAPKQKELTTNQLEHFTPLEFRCPKCNSVRLHSESSEECRICALRAAEKERAQNKKRLAEEKKAESIKLESEGKKNIEEQTRNEEELREFAEKELHTRIENQNFLELEAKLVAKISDELPGLRLIRDIELSFDEQTRFDQLIKISGGLDSGVPAVLFLQLARNFGRGFQAILRLSPAMEPSHEEDQQRNSELLNHLRLLYQFQLRFGQVSNEIQSMAWVELTSAISTNWPDPVPVIELWCKSSFGDIRPAICISRSVVAGTRYGHVALLPVSYEAARQLILLNKQVILEANAPLTDDDSSVAKLRLAVPAYWGKKNAMKHNPKGIRGSWGRPVNRDALNSTIPSDHTWQNSSSEAAYFLKLGVKEGVLLDEFEFELGGRPLVEHILREFTRFEDGYPEFSEPRGTLQLAEELRFLTNVVIESSVPIRAVMLLLRQVMEATKAKTVPDLRTAVKGAINREFESDGDLSNWDSWWENRKARHGSNAKIEQMLELNAFVQDWLLSDA